MLQVPIFVNANSGRFSGNTITLGARGDSYYEYVWRYAGVVWCGVVCDVMRCVA